MWPFELFLFFRTDLARPFFGHAFVTSPHLCCSEKRSNLNICGYFFFSHSSHSGKFHWTNIIVQLNYSLATYWVRCHCKDHKLNEPFLACFAFSRSAALDFFKRKSNIAVNTLRYFFLPHFQIDSIPHVCKLWMKSNRRSSHD